MRLLPWEYFFTRFDAHTFHDLYTPFWVANIVLLVALVVLYNARTRALHRHALITCVVIEAPPIVRVEDRFPSC